MGIRGCKSTQAVTSLLWSNMMLSWSVIMVSSFNLFQVSACDQHVSKLFIIVQTNPIWDLQGTHQSAFQGYRSITKQPTIFCGSACRSLSLATLKAACGAFGCLVTSRLACLLVFPWSVDHRLTKGYWWSSIYLSIYLSIHPSIYLQGLHTQES